MPARTAAKSLSWQQAAPAKIVLITGTEDLLTERAYRRVLASLQKSLGEDALEKISIAATGYQSGQLAQAAAPSLFMSPKIIRITGCGSAPDAFFKDLEAYAKQPADQVTLVLDVGEGRRGKKMWDQLKISFPWIDCPPLKYPSHKERFVREDAKLAGRQIRPDAVAALVAAAGNSARELAAAVSQLLSDTQGDITMKEVNRYYGGQTQSTVFDIADAVASGNMTLALLALRQAVAAGATPVSIVAVIAFKLRAVAKELAGITEGSPSAYAAKIVRQQARGWEERSIAGAISAVARADAAVKGAAKDALYAVENCIITCCRLRYNKI